ncbi:hypothetical protein BT63DRAFT_416180 [Microthyrium microscopicum]|uniref:Uncharacterized protein n=1 Tax=Microthyrium microscopicum TaxID=703497 RepID=A0A6A6U6Q2_9PEZI|nr:hypothetical protein BT63DRAFT_416180 [Microthyrium microscopicum]
MRLEHLLSLANYLQYQLLHMILGLRLRTRLNMFLNILRRIRLKQLLSLSNFLQNQLLHMLLNLRLRTRLNMFLSILPRMRLKHLLSLSKYVFNLHGLAALPMIFKYHKTISEDHSDQAKVSEDHSDQAKVSEDHSDQAKVSEDHSDQAKVSEDHRPGMSATISGPWELFDPFEEWARAKEPIPLEMPETLDMPCCYPIEKEPKRKCSSLKTHGQDEQVN